MLLEAMERVILGVSLVVHLCSGVGGAMTGFAKFPTNGVRCWITVFSILPRFGTSQAFCWALQISAQKESLGCYRCFPSDDKVSRKLLVGLDEYG